jgi:hypothetical protein
MSHASGSDGLTTAFMATENGRFTQRIIDAMGMRVTRITYVGKVHLESTFKVHLEPLPVVFPLPKG